MSDPYRRTPNNVYSYHHTSRMESNNHNRPTSAIGNQFVRQNLNDSLQQQHASNTFNQASSAIGNILKTVGYDVKSNSNNSSSLNQSATENDMNTFLSLNAPSAFDKSKSNRSMLRHSTPVMISPSVGMMPPPIPPPSMSMPPPPNMFIPPPMNPIPVPFPQPPMFAPPPPLGPISHLSMPSHSLLPTPTNCSDMSHSRGKKRSIDNDVYTASASTRQKSLSPLSKRMLKEISKHRYRDDFYSPDRSVRYDRQRDYSPELRRRSRDRSSRSSRNYLSRRTPSPEKESKTLENLKVVNHQLAEQVACDTAVISDLRNRIYALEESEKKTSEGKERKEPDDVEYIYKENSTYWCGSCSELSNSLLRALNHLTGNAHSINIKNKSCPWKKSTKKNVIKKRINAGNAEGCEFMRHVPSAFHCDLCLCFLGDMEEAEKHLKSYMHNREFYKYKIRHPDYVKTFKEKMKANMSDVDKSDADHSVREEEVVIANDDKQGDEETVHQQNEDSTQDSSQNNSADSNKNGATETDAMKESVDEQLLEEDVVIIEETRGDVPPQDLEVQKKNFDDISDDDDDNPEFDNIGVKSSCPSGEDASASVTINVVLEPQPVVPLGLPRKMVRSKATNQEESPLCSETNENTSDQEDPGYIDDLDLQIVDECV